MRFIKSFNLYEQQQMLNKQEREAIRFWTAGGQKVMRSVWNGNKKEVEYWKDYRVSLEEDYYKNGPKLLPYFIQAIDKLPDYNGIIWRGDRDIKWSDIKIGKEIILDFSSCSKSRGQAEHFGYSEIKNQGVLFCISTKTAKDISRYADKKYKYQDEIIIQGGTHFKVTDIHIPTPLDEWRFMSDISPSGKRKPKGKESGYYDTHPGKGWHQLMMVWLSEIG